MAVSTNSNSAGSSWWTRRGKWAALVAVALVVGVFPRLAMAAGTGDFAVSVTPASQTLAPGKSTQYLVEVSVVDGFASPVTLTARQQDGTPLPAGVTASFKPASLTGGGSSVMTLSVPSTITVGTQLQLSVVGTGGGLTRTSDASTSISFVLVERCLVTVEGVVRETTTVGGAPGAPVVGATVTARNNPGLTTTTDATGAYRLTNVPLGDNNAPIVGFGVEASKNPPAQNKIGDYWSKTGAADIVCGRTTKIDLTMVKVVPAVLSGSVAEGTLGPDGVTVVPVSPAAPVAGARVTAQGLAQATSAADGKFSFVDVTGATGVHVGEGNTPISPGITVDGPTSDPVRRRFWPVTVTSPAVTAGSAVQVPQVLLLRQCTAAVTGKVLNDADGAPVASATVRIDNADASDNTAVSTAADGTFRVPETLIGKNNAPGPFKVTVFKTGFNDTVSTTATSATCGSTLDVTVRIKAATAPPPDPTRVYGSLTGKVVDKDTGAPVAGSTVSLSNCRPATTGDCATSPTAADGTYTISRIPVGTVATPTTTVPGATTSSTSSSTTTTTLPPALSGTVTAQLVGFWSASASVTVKAGDPTKAPDLAILKQRTVSVSGTVSAEETQPNGSVVATGPLQGASVTVSTGICTATGATTCSTGADGVYAASEVDLAPGNLGVTRSVTTSKAGYWTRSTEFTAELGTPKVVDVKLRKQCTATIVGTVRNSKTLLPIDGATVSVPSGSQYPATSPRQVITGADGTFAITNVLLGPDNVDKSVVVTGAAVGYYNSSLTAAISGCGSTTELNFGTPPAVATVTPSTGPAEGGTTVSILGTEFTPDVSVRFGSASATSVTRVSATELTAVTPPGSGSVEVVVSNSIGSSSPTTGSVFTYELPTTTSTSTTSTSTTSTTTTSTTSTTVRPTTTTVPSTTTTTVPTTTTTVRPTTTTVPSTTTTVRPTTTTTSTTTTSSTTTTVRPTTTTVPTTTTTVPATTTTVRPTTTTTTVPPAAACSPTAVSLDLRLDNGSTVRVDATYNVELFGLLRYWSGSLGGTLRASTTSAGRTFLAGGATTDPVITGLPGSACGARINIAALDFGTPFPWDYSQLVLDVAPNQAGTGAQVAGSFAGVKFGSTAGTGRATVR